MTQIIADGKRLHVPLPSSAFLSTAPVRTTRFHSSLASLKFSLFRNVLGVFHWAGYGSSPPKGCSETRAGRFGCAEHQPEHVPRSRVGTSMRRSPAQTRRDTRRSPHFWPLPWTNLGPRAAPQTPYDLIPCFSSLKAVFSGFYPLNRRYTPAIWRPTPPNRQ